jgi:hypothetical protein
VASKKAKNQFTKTKLSQKVHFLFFFFFSQIFYKQEHPFAGFQNGGYFQND